MATVSWVALGARGNVSAVHDAGAASPVLSQQVFHDVVLRERQRADRFDEPFLLLLVSLHSVAEALRQRVSSRVVESLAAVTQTPALVGWFRDGRVLGLILPDAGPQPRSSSDELLTRLRGELAGRLEPEFVSLLSIRLDLESCSDATASPAALAEARALVSDGAKRILDIVGSLGMLVVLAPILLVIAAAVKLTSPGPVLFRQERVGQRGRSFTMLKFRTMHAHADRSIHEQYVTQFIRANGASDVRSQPMCKMVNDPRITRVGRFLRKTSLDELPQFWNVLVGEMSLVGPRPPLPYEVAKYRRWHLRRIRLVKPGITGLWQVNGRSRTTFDEMVRLDLQYVRTQSLWTDIKILAATPRAVISGKGAS
jgi:exopolysaccharide biosynthesis polyprenyl glycosylphosphotransferase